MHGWRASVLSATQCARSSCTVSLSPTSHRWKGPLRVLDAGCGQGTQAIALARLGHDVVGLDLSGKLLDEARRGAAEEPASVRRRLCFVSGDLLALGDEHAASYDVVCCHGVAMYLPSLDAPTLNYWPPRKRPGAGSPTGRSPP